MIQAEQSEGIVKTQGTYRWGVHHTLTVWENKEAMQKYLRSGAHKEAMMRSKDIGSYVKVYGYGSDEIPTMNDALELWNEKGRMVFQNKQRRKINSSGQQQSMLWSGFAIFVILCSATKLLPMEKWMGSLPLLQASS